MAWGIAFVFYGALKMYRRIRDLREDRDISKLQVARILEISQTGCSKHETATPNAT